jgi:hypothetical protein
MSSTQSSGAQVGRAKGLGTEGLRAVEVNEDGEREPQYAATGERFDGVGGEVEHAGAPESLRETCRRR